MKLAVLADIHSNPAAFQVVLDDLADWKPDRVVVAGDVINRGPQPHACMELVLERISADHWEVLRGNHEDFVLRESTVQENRPDWEAKLCAHTAWTCEEVAPFLDDIRAWPDHIEVELPDGETIKIVHASLKGNRYGIHRRLTDEEIKPLIHPSPTILCVGHTHIPGIREINSTRIINVGAAGLPFDGDARASYGRFTWSDNHIDTELVRLDYDRQPTRDAFKKSGYLKNGGPMVPLIKRELEEARPHLVRWHRHYETQVVSGKISIEESIEKLMTT